METLKNILDFIGFAICHQIPAKSFFAFSRPVSLCARDQGIYLAFFTVFLFYYLLTLNQKKKPVELPSLLTCFLLLSISMLMPLDALLQLFGYYFSNASRLFSGLAFGFGIAPFVLFLFTDGFYLQKSKKVFFNFRVLSVLFIFLFLLGFLMLFQNDYYVFAANLLSIIGFTLLFLMINYSILFLLFGKAVKKNLKLKRYYLIILSSLLVLIEILLLRYFHNQALLFS